MWRCTLLLRRRDAASTRDPHRLWAQVFDAFDGDRDGVVTAADLRSIMTNLGEKLSDREIGQMVAEADRDKNNIISKREFLDVMQRSKGKGLWRKASRIATASEVLRLPAGYSGLAPEAAAVKASYDLYRNENSGHNASYIPILKNVSPKLFAVALVTADGKLYTAGETGGAVSIQSVSKPFTLALAMQHRGPQAIVENMGVVATGREFNSIKAIEEKNGHGMNPCVNAGAIVTTSMIPGRTDEEMFARIINFYSRCAGRALHVNQDVYASEALANHRNRAISQLMHAYGKIKERPLEACDVYTKQCAISVTVTDLAYMAATLAFGRSVRTGEEVIAPYNIPKILAVMATAGLYDDSGHWLYECGLPAKSGVGGGIIAVSPGRYGIAAISPPLDAAGNSVRAVKAITYIANVLDCNPYAPGSWRNVKKPQLRSKPVAQKSAPSPQKKR